MTIELDAETGYMVDRSAMSLSQTNDVITYKSRLDQDFTWALEQGGRHFRERSEVHFALHRVCQRLSELAVPFCIVGDLAMFKHGYRRFTEVVELLVTRTDLVWLHEQLVGSGYVEPFPHCKHLLDAASGVDIRFSVTGEYPGDKRPKPIRIPHPSHVSEVLNGVPVITLPRLIELKLAAGGSSPGRLSEIADVQELLKHIRLPRELAAQLHADLQAAYLELWESVQTLRILEDEEIAAEQAAICERASHASIHR